MLPAAPRAFAKPARSPADLLAHLTSRGLIVADSAAALRTLETVGYYRLLIYMRPLQVLPTKAFQAGVTFDDVVQLYDFDRHLRLHCRDAIEQAEVALRAAINNRLSVALGPHFYLNPRSFEQPARQREFLKKVLDARYLAIGHYYDRYDDPALPPIWAITEAVTFGTLSKLFADLTLPSRKLVARTFGYDEKVLVSWFRSLNDLRNKCAHHNRVWNANFAANQPSMAREIRQVFGLQPRTNLFYARAVVLAALLDAVGRSGT